MITQGDSGCRQAELQARRRLGAQLTLHRHVDLGPTNDEAAAIASSGGARSVPTTVTKARFSGRTRTHHPPAETPVSPSVLWISGRT